MDSGIAN